jgi:hypothetical protein
LSEHKIEPHRVTKPIQLLAAWLVGLILTNGSFLGAAVAFPEATWERGALVVASIANVPIFLLALFLLQTRFRAELQEDSFYADYLSKKTAAPVRIDKDSAQDSRLDGIERAISHIAPSKVSSQAEVSSQEQRSAVVDWRDWKVGLNEHHPRFREIREAFRRAGIPVGDIFGAGRAPSKWLISLANHLPVEHKVKILRVALPFGFDGIQFWDPQREAEEYEDAYLGSYGGGTYAPVTEELVELVSQDVEGVDLKHYYSKHKVQSADA